MCLPGQSLALGGRPVPEGVSVSNAQRGSACAMDSYLTGGAGISASPSVLTVPLEWPSSSLPSFLSHFTIYFLRGS